MRRDTTRRRFLATSAAAATGVALGDLDALAQRPGGPNLILVIVDSLRADAVYDRHIHTPNIDLLLASGLRFTSAYPEAMPTVPARNSILGGRRTFPFRNWHDYPGLLDSPGWSPLRDVDESLPAVLRRAGYWTAYVTDNPFLGFSRPYAPLRASVELVRAHRRPDRRQPPGLERPGQGAAPLAAPLDLARQAQARRPLPRQQPLLEQRAPLVRGQGHEGRRARARAGLPSPPVRADRRHLRAARAVDPAAAVRGHVRRSGAVASPRCRATARSTTGWRRASAARSCAACASSTRPR